MRQRSGYFSRTRFSARSMAGRASHHLLAHRLETPAQPWGLLARVNRREDGLAPARAFDSRDLGPVIHAEERHGSGPQRSSAVSQPSVCGNGEDQHSVCTRCSPTNGLVSGFEMRRSQAGQIGFPCASSLLVNAGLQIRKVF